MDRYILLLLFAFLCIYFMRYSNNSSALKTGGGGSKRMKNKYKLKLKQKVYTKILRKTQLALDELNIPFFLSSGTCLGYFRENKFIDHDYDIDIGIFYDDYTPLIIDHMKKQGLYLYRVLGNIESGYEMSFIYPGTAFGRSAKIDIFVHYYTEDSNSIYWTSYSAPSFTKKVKYQVPKFDLKLVEFMGLDVYVPDPTINYIAAHYGDDWHITKKPRWLGGTYSYSRSPKSII